MTVEEVFSKVIKHQIKGIMFHEQMANYYDFLNLGGYKRCHEYHYFEESVSMRKTMRYFINHFNKLIPDVDIDIPSVIPDSWYRYTREDVDISTKKNAVKIGVQKWKDWEASTIDLYQDMYNELLSMNEIAAATHVKMLILDVDKELKKVTRYYLNKKAIDYDLTSIVEEQEEMHDSYKHKTHRIRL